MTPPNKPVTIRAPRKPVKGGRVGAQRRTQNETAVKEEQQTLAVKPVGRSGCQDPGQGSAEGIGGHRPAELARGDTQFRHDDSAQWRHHHEVQDDGELQEGQNRHNGHLIAAEGDRLGRVHETLTTFLCCPMRGGKVWCGRWRPNGGSRAGQSPKTPPADGPRKRAGWPRWEILTPRGFPAPADIPVQRFQAKQRAALRQRGTCFSGEQQSIACQEISIHRGGVVSDRTHWQ